MVLHDSYGRDARHEARRATGHVLVKSLNRARHPTVLVGWIRLFCLKCPKNPTVLVGWEMSEIFSGMNQTDPFLKGFSENSIFARVWRSPFFRRGRADRVVVATPRHLVRCGVVKMGP